MRSVTIDKCLRAVLWCCLLLIANPANAEEPEPGSRPGMMRGPHGQGPNGPRQRGPGQGGRPLNGPGMGDRSAPAHFGANGPQMMQAARERMMNMPAEERAKFRERHKQARDQRRAGKVSSMRTRWGPQLKDPALQAELRLNAERMARLHRMQALAEDNGKEALLNRVFELMKREQQRHMRTMSQLRGAPGSPGVGDRKRSPSDRAPAAASAPPATEKAAP